MTTPANLGEVLDITSGFAFSSKNFSESTGTPIIRIRDVARGRTDLKFDGDYDPRYLVDDGDLLISMDGEFRLAEWRGGKALLNQRVCRVEPKDERVDRSFLKHFLPKKLKEIEDQTPFVTVKHLSVKSIRAIELPDIPNSEQRRIAAILDKADAIRRKREHALDLADEFLKSVFLEMFGDPVTNPRGYRQTPLGDVLKVSSGNGLTAKMMDPKGSYPVYGGNGINGYHSEFMFEEPQIVIGRVGVYCGAVHISEPKSWITDNALYVREYKMPINQTYLEWALRFANLNQYAGRAAQPLISGSRIYPIEIVVPEDEEQNRFERVVQKKLALTKKLGAAVEASEIFFGSLSQRAFRGEL